MKITVDQQKRRTHTSRRTWPARKTWALSAGSLMLLFSGVLHAAPQSMSCDAMAKIALPDARITAAEVVQKGQFKTPAGPGPQALLQTLTGIHAYGQVKLGPNPAFCRITATATPTSDSSINIEVWLPLKGWNGKFLGTGNFAWGGYFMYPVMLSGLEKGYATASTDTGHDEGNPQQKGGSFIVGHPEKLIDYAYRAHHLMAVNSKLIIDKFYGKHQDKSYWIGCSLGGLEGLIEAKRYPSDYDGMVIGAPPNPLLYFNAAQLWPVWLVHQHPEMKMSNEKFALVHNAVLKSCASPVGQKQGFVDEPNKCAFEPKQLLCKGGDNKDCLTAPQVSLMEKIYTGPVNPKTGKVIFQGPAKGSELEMIDFASQPHQTSLDLFRYAVYKNPAWDWTKFDWDKDISQSEKTLGTLLQSDAELKPFFDHGGKMLMYIGWNDFHNPHDLINYYQRMLKNAGPDHAESARLFVVPGMAHCHSGDGCDTFNKLGALDAWMTQNRLPERMVASRVVDGKVVRTRPVCAWPEVAHYKGKGDINDAASFQCVK